jgi:hypothetical protein
MERQIRFSETVCDKLSYYVYRLIDPRNGTTFYVGRGQGNRVFSHAAGLEKADGLQDNIALKLKTIWAIKNAGFTVGHVIHRHGMNEDQVKEVESALIDAYPGLTNIQIGQDSERGVMHAEEIINLYEAEEAAFQHDLILINVNKTSEDEDLYDAVRYAWKIDPKRAGECEYVLAVRKGLIIGAFKAEEWLPAIPENFPTFVAADDNRKGPREGRYGFRGIRAPEDIERMYVGRRLPEGLQKRGAANPVRYWSVATSSSDGVA